MSIRYLQESDLELVLRWRNDDRVRHQMFSTKKISNQEQLEWFSAMRANSALKWYIHENDSGVADGVVYFTNYCSTQRSAFWGFYKNPDAVPGTGIQLGRDALAEAFDILKLHKLNADVLASNIPSLNFHKKLGFVVEGTFKQHHYDGTRYIDVVRYAMFEDEWDHNKNSPLKSQPIQVKRINVRKNK